MESLSKTGRIFYGVAIAEIGLQAIYNRDFPYILSLPAHIGIPGHVALASIFGILFTLAGASIVFEKRTGQISLLFGWLLLFLFCFYYIPYEFLTSPIYTHFADWENAEKELTLTGGALVIAGCFPAKNETLLSRFLAKLIPAGAILFSITMIGYGTLHFIVAKDAATLIPSWIPYHLFWIYFCGAALIGSGIAIITKINVRIIAALLGAMIFIWFIVLHIPRMIAAPGADRADEITSACFALAYSGIAFVISGRKIKNQSPKFSDPGL